MFENETIYSVNDKVLELENNVCLEGSLDSKVVVFFENEHQAQINGKEKELLFKILNAVGLKAEEVLLCNTIKGMPFAAVYDRVQFNKALFFDVQMKRVHLTIEPPLYRLTTFGKIDLLFSESLEALEMDIEKKKALWGQLQRMFKKDS